MEKGCQPGVGRNPGRIRRAHWELVFAVCMSACIKSVESWRSIQARKARGFGPSRLLRNPQRLRPQDRTCIAVFESRVHESLLGCISCLSLLRKLAFARAFADQSTSRPDIVVIRASAGMVSVDKLIFSASDFRVAWFRQD